MPFQAIVSGALIVVAGLLWACARGRPRVALGAFVALLAATLMHTLAYDSLQDDAFISFRYASHWANGLGPIFNPGERVEGYSNFLLVALLAFANGVLGADIVTAAVCVGVASTLALVVSVRSWASELADGDPHAGLIAATLVAGASGVAAYGRSGLETTLFCLLVVSALRSASRDSLFAAGALAGLATLARPDGVISFMAVALTALAVRSQAPTRLLRATAAYGLLVVPWTIWRVAYYGHLIPNQIVAKSGMEPSRQLMLGLDYLGRWIIANAPLVLLLAVTLAAWVWVRRRSPIERRDVPLLAGLFGALAFPVSTGGDWMPAYRLLVPATVLACVAIARFWSLAAGSGAPRPASRACAAIVVLAACGCVVIGVGERRSLPAVVALREIVDGEEDIGRWLARRLPPDTLIAAWANGAIPYYSDLPTIDLLGLTDEHIARKGKRRREGQPGHIAYDHDYVIGRAPALVTFLGGDGLAPNPNDGMIDAFRAAYRPVSFVFTQRGGPRRYANIWVRKDAPEDFVPSLADPEAGIRLVRRPPTP